MASPTHIQHPGAETVKPHPLSLLTRDQVKAMAALMLIGTGVFFALAYAGSANWSSPWWVMYLAIPSFMLLLAAGNSILQTRKVTGYAATNALLGLLGIAVSIIMVKDPTWSFTRAWDLDEYFPFLRKISWDPVWQWMLVILGMVSLCVAILQRVVGIGVFGALLIVIGGTFLLDLPWDSVWPLVVVALGAGLLFQLIRKK
jgi:hypothetical protein